jgi:hypothetical protein
MKKIVTLLAASLFTIGVYAEERPITFGELPQNAKKFVLTYFKDVPVEGVYMERHASLTQYELKMAEGLELQFDRTGICTEIQKKKGAIPEVVIPKKILDVVKANFPKNVICKYEHNGRMYEVELDNDVVLTFSNSFRLVDVDK